MFNRPPNRRTNPQVTSESGGCAFICFRSSSLLPSNARSRHSAYPSQLSLELPALRQQVSTVLPHYLGRNTSRSPCFSRLSPGALSHRPQEREEKQESCCLPTAGPFQGPQKSRAQFPYPLTTSYIT